MPLSPMSVTRLQRMLLQNPGSLAAFDRVFSWEVLILTFAYYMASPFWSTADCYCLMADKMLIACATNYVAQRNLF